MWGLPQGCRIPALGCVGRAEGGRIASLSRDLRAMRPLPQGSQISGQENGCGKCGVERAGAVAADRFIVALLALGVCLSQASGLVKGGNVKLYSTL